MKLIVKKPVKLEFEMTPQELMMLACAIMSWLMSGYAGG